MHTSYAPLGGARANLDLYFKNKVEAAAGKGCSAVNIQALSANLKLTPLYMSQTTVGHDHHGNIESIL